MAKGWFRRKKEKLVLCWYNANGNERSKVVGRDTVSDVEGWMSVGEIGLDILLAKSAPINISFGD